MYQQHLNVSVLLHNYIIINKQSVKNQYFVHLIMPIVITEIKYHIL